MIESFEGIYTAVCDSCGKELDGEFEFMDAVASKKDAGWKSKRVGSDWEDVCDECLREERKKEASVNLDDINGSFDVDALLDFGDIK